MRISLWACCILAAALVPLPAKAVGIVVLEEDFEDGLAGWEALHYHPDLNPEPNNHTPMVFEADGAGIYGPNNNYPGSRSVGYSSDITPYDGTAASYLRILLPNAVPPGEYEEVIFEADIYRFKEHDDYWGLGNRLYVLTDDQYDDPYWNFDGPDPYPHGFRKSTWIGDDGWAWDGTWQHIEFHKPNVVTDTGNIEIRLLMHDKYAGPQTVAWDNIRVTFVPEPGSLGLLALAALGLVRRRRR